MSIRYKFLVAAFLSVCGLPALCKGLLVLQVGSDWCESGEDVRRVFLSRDFQSPLSSSFDFAVYDDMDSPTPDVAKANETLKDLRVESSRFPAITCLTSRDGHFFAQFENIPYDITADKLSRAILTAVKAKDKAEALFRKGAALNGQPQSAADCYGEGFALLTTLVGENCAQRLRKGRLSYEKEWQTLQKFDADDKFGWCRRFEMGYGFNLVDKATKFRQDSDMSGGANYIASLRRIPTNHLTVVQRQCVNMTEYAFYRKDAGRDAANKKLLKETLDMGRNTVWGQCALGYLILAGGQYERRPRYRAAVKSREGLSVGKMPEFQINTVEKRLEDITAKQELNEAQKRDIALYAVLRRIGKEGWDELRSRPGASKFISAFFRDRKWMEDFVWSGPCDGAKAILALESICFQDDGRWIDGDGPGRRCATAMALECSNHDEAWLADYFDAYRATALAKRLHMSAKTQPVWRWRFALQQSHPASSPDDPANQQRYLQKFLNVPIARLGGACWNVPYRSYNCFGESVQGPRYYEAWAAAGEWPKRRYSHLVGGVCGELSKFGSACSNAHGLPSTTAGQPGHCAYTRRLLDGSWQINNCVGSPTSIHLTLFANRHPWTYLQAHEWTFGGEREMRMEADRFTELAFLSDKRGNDARKTMTFFARACKSYPKHLYARKDFFEWIVANKRPLKEYRVIALDTAKSLRGVQAPLWDFLTPYFERVAKEEGLPALSTAIAEAASLLRQGENRGQEVGAFGATMAKWMKPLDSAPELKRKTLGAVLSAQVGTRDFFSQLLSSFGGFIVSDSDMMKRFAEVVAGNEKGSEVSLSPLIFAASRDGNLPAFVALSRLQDKITPPKFNGKAYPENDYGFPLVSAGGMLGVSTTSNWDSPHLHAHAIDATPCQGGSFHTAKEQSPWALVTLPGVCEVKGITVENRSPSQFNRSRQVPIEIQTSEDGKDWRTVMTDETVRETYRVDMRTDESRTQYIRVRRTPGAKNEVFHLSKILVYGKKLY